MKLLKVSIKLLKLLICMHFLPFFSPFSRVCSHNRVNESSDLDFLYLLRNWTLSLIKFNARIRLYMFIFPFQSFLCLFTRKNFPPLEITCFEHTFIVSYSRAACTLCVVSLNNNFFLVLI